MVRRNRSIQGKIQLAIALTSAGVVLLLAVMLLFTQYSSARHELESSLHTLSRMAASNLVAPLAFDAPEDAQDVLQTLSAIPDLRAVAVLRADGTVFVHHSFGGGPTLAIPNMQQDVAGHLWQGDRILVSAPVELDGQALGVVWLACGLGNFHARIRRIVVWGTGLYLVATALAVLVAWLLQRVITRPILELARVADRTILEGPTSVRAHKRDDDEIGVLVDSFNHMLDHIAEQSERLRDRERCYRTLFAQAANAILLENGDRRVVEANQTAATLFNQSETNLIGKSTAELFALATLPAPAVGERVKIARSEARLNGGDTVPVELSVTGISDRGKHFFLTSAIDIRDRIRAQELLVRSRDELQVQVNAATAELREANASLQREMDERRRLERQMMLSEKLKGLGLMAGGIAHDFNNLLQTILGNTDLLLDEAAETLGEEGRHSAGEIRRAARAAADLVSQMLAYAGKSALRIAPVDINDLLRSMQPLFDAAVPKNVRSEFELGEDLPQIDADESQLRQVVMNLVINAAESHPGPGGIYTIRTGIRHCDREFLQHTLLHENLPTGHYLFLSVQDNGCGIEPDQIERIFDPFFSTKFAGRGLGLASVLGIVRAHRAAIMVESKPGKGATFTLFFPTTFTAPIMMTDAPTVAPDWHGEGLVLVADDEEGVRHVAKRMLDLLGFTVETVADGAEAVEFCRRHGGQVALYILDVTMPGVGGIQAARQILAIDPDARILLSSAYGIERVQHAIGGIRICGFLRNPYEKNGLRDQLANILGPQNPPDCPSLT